MLNRNKADIFPAKEERCCKTLVSYLANMAEIEIQSQTADEVNAIMYKRALKVVATSKFMSQNVVIVDGILNHINIHIMEKYIDIYLIL